MRIYERCACGGTIEVDGTGSSEVVAQVESWRAQHQGHAVQAWAPSTSVPQRAQPWYEATASKTR